MHMKSSYRLLKWTFLAGAALTLASACVVSSGDGNDDDTDITEGGDGGTSSTGGKASSGSSAGGSSSGATSEGGMSTTDGGEPATGGTPSTFEPGECQVDEMIQPTVLPVCDAADGDSDCIKCVKLQACDEYKTCFGEEPATACGRGMTEDSLGQFDCVVKCFDDGAAEALDADELLADCAAECDECNSGGLNDETTDIIAAANDPETCQIECFPF
jgi:hypothetical protein